MQYQGLDHKMSTFFHIKTITRWHISVFILSLLYRKWCILRVKSTFFLPHIWLKNTLVHSDRGQLSDCRLPRSCGCKTSPNHQPSITMLQLFFPICYVWFSPNEALCIMTKQLHFDLVCPKNRSVIGGSDAANPRDVSMFLLQGRGSFC